jgi:hypothetical protein
MEREAIAMRVIGRVGSFRPRDKAEDKTEPSSASGVIKTGKKTIKALGQPTT